MFLEDLASRDSEAALTEARTFVAQLGPLPYQMDCSFEGTEDFGGRPAGYIDFFPEGEDLAQDHKKFGGLFIRVWTFGEPATVTYGLFLGAERAEQSEPRRGVAITREKLGRELENFEATHGFSYQTWRTRDFPWTTKSSRAVARQLEQFISFRQDPFQRKDIPEIEKHIGTAIHFLQVAIEKLRPIRRFGREIIEAYYGENLPDPASRSPIEGEPALLELVRQFKDAAENEASLKVDELSARRFAACLLAKRFLILTGLSGSGKTKIAQAFAQWVTPAGEGRYRLIPVGADWTASDNILGYPNGLHENAYTATPALELLLQAQDAPEVPHFLILDEMNLSHVERYFADFLSAIESDEGLSLYPGKMDDPGNWRMDSSGQPIPSRLEKLPDNLFIIGTVNVDETTYMFSPKVLDRANVIEFRMPVEDLRRFLVNIQKPELGQLVGLGSERFGKAFAKAGFENAVVTGAVKERFDEELLLFFQTLQEHGAEFGYRTAHEAARFTHFYKLLGRYGDDDVDWLPEAFDCIIVQKFLPKLHGSRTKLGPLLKALWFLCVNNEINRGENPLKSAKDAARSTDATSEPSLPLKEGVPYPLSADKIARMWRLLKENGFASFAEA